MPLLKSLFCFNGLDNGRRYLIISMLCYFFFLLLSPVLAKSGLLLILLLLCCTPVLLASAVRRVRDAGFNQILCVLPVSIFILSVFTITYIEHGASWGLLGLALILNLALGLISNIKVRHQESYQMGYSGPVELFPRLDKASNNNGVGPRIEPTIAQGHTVNLSASEIEKEFADPRFIKNYASNTNTNPGNSTWLQQASTWFENNQKRVVIGVSFLGVIGMMIFIGLLTTESENVKQDNQQAQTSQEVKQRFNKIAMPDNFWIMLDQHNALTLGWQGDYKADGLHWSPNDGVGDKTCIDLVFGNNDKFRTMQVTIKNQGDYYADFSPVDTKAIVRAIALKSRFNLCGYDFSLKGTQAKLMNNKKYSEYFD